MGTTISTLAVAPVDGFGAITVYNGSNKPVRVIADLAGYYLREVVSTGQLTWGASSLISSQFVDVSGLSCASATFCLASNSLGRIFKFDGHQWSDGDRNPNGEQIRVVKPECISSTLCFAFDSSGIRAYNGSSWGPGVQVAESSLNISCVGANFCIGVNEQSWYKYNGASWTGPFQIQTLHPAQFWYVSCVSATACISTGPSNGTSDGDAVQFDGTSWSLPTTITTSPYIQKPSCKSPTFCFVVDWDITPMVFNGVGWNEVLAPFATYFGTCASTTLCLASNPDGFVTEFDGTSFAPPVQLAENSIRAMSCPSDEFCMVIDSNGYAILGTA